MRRAHVTCLAGLLAAAGCGDATATPPPIPDAAGSDAGLGEPPVEWTADELYAELARRSDMTADELISEYAVATTDELGYTPTEAEHMELIQASALALDADELAMLDEHGFVISERHRFTTFALGYQRIYAADLPVYVSADSILEAVHRSYDLLLKRIETAALVSELEALLVGMRAELAVRTDLPARQSVDFYLAVALSLLTGDAPTAVAGADAAEIGEVVEMATAASGTTEVELFGTPREVDFSQFEPRGHYEDYSVLRQYFRAMMWLGRVDLRILETQPDHSQVFHVEQFHATVAIALLLEGEALSRWERIDRTIAAFVGEPDFMTPSDVETLAAVLGVDRSGLLAVPPPEITRAILAEGLGSQRISSHIMINGLGQGTLPPNVSFAMLGQRYVVDSHVFSNVVYDRVADGSVARMMPDPLDVAFAALGNDHAASLLRPELERYPYAPDLYAMRYLVDAHPAEFWDENLYNHWLSSLRALSPSREAAAAEGLPAVARSEAWNRRLTNTQLASWAELRHDTVLYAKQSYTGGSTCEFPDGYVDPYPEFYAALGELADRAVVIVNDLADVLTPETITFTTGYLAELRRVMDTLEEMARYERAGTPFTAEHLAFLNDTVTFSVAGCASTATDGWYGAIHLDRVDVPTEYDPVIADVHTQPTDEAGVPVGRVLHAGTGMPRTMTVTVDTCAGPRAYVGLASSYFETITRGFERRTDSEWASELRDATPPDVDWMRDLVVR